MGHGHPRRQEGHAPPAAPGRGANGGGTLGTLLKVSAGAGLALVGAYGLSRLGQHRNRLQRLERLEAMMAALSRQEPGGEPGEG